VTEEARLEQLAAGLTPVTDGWFVVNVRDAAWVTNETLGDACTFEGDGTPPFGEIGYTLGVLRPGVASGLYHRESNQEDFLVLAGECVLLIEGEERHLRAWEFVHCPPETEHIFVGAGDGPCVIFMAGGRTGEQRITYPRSELALRHGAGVEEETTVPREAYAPFPNWEPGRPARWAGLPWDDSFVRP
jgi:uncharacterized cupin superfamily protein